MDEDFCPGDFTVQPFLHSMRSNRSFKPFEEMIATQQASEASKSDTRHRRHPVIYNLLAERCQA